MTNIVLLGSGGLMGRYLADILPGAESGWEIHKFRKSELNITDTEKSVRLLDEIKPDAVVNAAAFCRMEECELNPDYSQAVNARAPAWWARSCHERGIRFLHLSTDYVFGGGRGKPYTEEDAPKPLSVYARHKREAEEALLEFPEHFIVRPAWIFGVGGSTFMSRIPGLLRSQEELRVATDRMGGCLYAAYGAERLRDLLRSAMGDKESVGGLFHLTHRGAVTWQEFAAECKRQMLERGLDLKNRNIVPVPAGSHEALQAPRPDYSVLDLGKTETLLGRELSSWQEGLSSYLDELMKLKTVTDLTSGL